MKTVEQSVELLWYTPEPEKQIERAGRTCYKSEDMIEHASASFIIVTDRGISHEIVRHRISSYAQEPTRYCNYSKKKFGNELTFIRPPGLEGKSLYAWTFACKRAEGIYMELLGQGVTPQIARSVLPTCLKTEIVMTCNFREWMYFIKLRGSKAAHPQIRVIANLILEELKAIAPSIF